jgi:SagB-type dehydrogenase family enzyme
MSYNLRYYLSKFFIENIPTISSFSITARWPSFLSIFYFLKITLERRINRVSWSRISLDPMRKFSIERKLKFFQIIATGISFFIWVGTAFPEKSLPKAMEKISMAPSAEIITLPPPRVDGEVSVERALQQRRSRREFNKALLSIQDISQLLWSAQGITDEQGLRTAPSAGALYPLEVYLVVGTVENISPGVYRYRPHAHQLKRVSKGDKRSDLASAALDQEYVENGAVVLVFSGVENRTTGKYGRRGIRYIHMEAGHAAQNVFLQAESLGLGMVPVGAFDDKKVQRIMQMPEGEHPLYLIPIGKP